MDLFILKTVFNFTFQFTHPVRDVIAFDVWLRGDLFQFTHPVRDVTANNTNCFILFTMFFK